MNQPGVFLSADWRYLAMANFEIEPSVLADIVPADTVIDFWQGRTYVSLVGFMFLNTRLLGVPIPLHRHFEEFNLRFYVQRETPTESRRGVAFVKEIVPRWAIATVARKLYNENYVARRMFHQYQLDPQNPAHLLSGSTIEYGWWEAGKRQAMQMQVGPELRSFRPGEEAEFIAEHYWGYACQLDGGCKEYQVEHPPWQVWDASDVRLTIDVERVYGKRFADALSRPPRSAFIALGSPIAVRKGQRIK